MACRCRAEWDCSYSNSSGERTIARGIFLFELHQTGWILLQAAIANGKVKQMLEQSMVTIDGRYFDRRTRQAFSILRVARYSSIIPGLIVVARILPKTGSSFGCGGRSSVLSPGHSASSRPFPILATRAQNVSGVVCEEAGEGVRRRMATILLIDDEAE